jgi:hypothetical protein
LQELLDWFEILFEIAVIAFCTLVISLVIREFWGELLRGDAPETAPGKVFWLWYCFALTAIAAAIWWL